jgi:hypothetical protein
MAVKDVLYDQTTAVRRRLLDVRFRVARSDDARTRRLGLEGAMVQIDRTPYELPEDFDGTDAMGLRARAVLDALAAYSRDKTWWESEAEANRAVKTALSKVPTERAASLMLQAYVVTMANAHVLMDLPLGRIPTLDEMVELVR